MSKFSNQIMEEIVDPLTEFFADKPKIWLPEDEIVRNAFIVYGPSFQTENFLSEEGRNIYGEACKSKSEHKRVERLQNLCVEFLAKDFKGGCLDERLKYDNLVLFGEKLDINLPLEDLIQIEVTSYLFFFMK